MIKFKSCPRCGVGDLVREEEVGGYVAFTCLQCGHEIPDNDLSPMTRPGSRALDHSTGRHTAANGGAQ